MFQLTENEKADIIVNFNSLKNLKYSPHLPYAFTEHGAVMLASILNSEIAIKVNIQIVRIFTRIRESLLTHKDVLFKLEKVEREFLKQNETNKKFENEIHMIFEALKQLLEAPQPLPRKNIGYRRPSERE